LKEWDLSDGLSRHKAALDMLSQLEVFIEVSNQNGGPPLREPMPSNVDADLISFIF